jgi:hypothetical protein
MIMPHGKRYCRETSLVIEELYETRGDPVTVATTKLRVELQAAWEAYRAAEPTAKGLTLGRLCCELRDEAEVVQGGTTFRATLAEIGIPKSTAYYWMERYERPDEIDTSEVDEDIPLLQEATPLEKIAKIATVREGMRLRWNGRTLSVGKIESRGDRLLISGEWL